MLDNGGIQVAVNGYEAGRSFLPDRGAAPHRWRLPSAVPRW
jgi:hypothetical protein